MNSLRKIIRQSIGVLGCAAAYCLTSPAQSPVAPPAKENFHIYLLMGQSNMAGRGELSGALPGNNPRVLCLNGEEKWVIAKDPLHPKVGRIEPGVGPGMSFAIEMLKADTKVTIGLVPCAVGGTSLQQWVKGGDLYEKAVSRAKVAAHSGVIEGMLWHQGESDSDKEEFAKTYEARLAQMFKDFRADLESPGLPIVVGQLGEFVPQEKHPFVQTVRFSLSHVPQKVENVGYADSTGLKDKGDKLHFTAEAQRELGIRYAKAMVKLQKR